MVESDKEFSRLKKTEIGMIPEKWDVMTLQSICEREGLVRGPFGGSLKKECFVNKGYKVYEQRNAIYGDLNIGSYYINDKKFNELSRFEVESGDFIVSCSGTIGKIFMIPRNATKGIINQALLKIKINKKIVDDKYFNSYFEWDKFQSRIIESTQGGAMKNLVGMDIFKNVLIAIPPRDEQEAIASALSNIDDLILFIEKLINKKKLIKQGVEEKLLTGKIRINGSSDKWNNMTLDDITMQDGLVRGPFGGSLKKEFFVSKGYKVYEQKNAIYEDFSIGNYFIDDKKYKELIRFEVNPGDFIVSCSGTIGRIYKIPKNAPKGVINQALLKIVVNTNIVDEGYFKHYFSWDKFQSKIIESTQGGAMKNLVGMDVFKNTSMLIPSLDEQKIISEILTNMDQEIEKLESKLNKYKNIKNGMMEELLTGKRRLV